MNVFLNFVTDVASSLVELDLSYVLLGSLIVIASAVLGIRFLYWR